MSWGTKTLNDIMQFDHVIEVLPGGAIIDRPDLYAPTLLDEDLDSSEWEFFSIGYTGQHGSRNQPIMHNSEFIGGRLERDIRSTPGVYAAIVANWLPEDDEDRDAELDVEGWAVVTQEAPARQIAIDVLQDCWEADMSPSAVVDDSFGSTDEADVRFVELATPAFEAAADKVGVELVVTSDAVRIDEINKTWPDQDARRAAWQAVHDAVEADLLALAEQAVREVS